MTLAPRQHQMGTDTERGQSLALGACRLALVADYQPQDWMASRHAGLLRDVFPTSLLTGAGFGRRPFPHSHWSRFPSRTATNCGVSCSLRALPRINSVASRVSSTARLNTLADQQSVNAFADLLHVTRRLSSSPSPAGFKTSSKDLTCEAQALSSDDKIHD